MPNFISFVEQKNAIGFEAALHERLASKISNMLDGLREVVAANIFNEDNCIQTPGGDKPGGISGVTTSSREPAPPKSIKIPGNSGKGTKVGHGMPDKNEGQLDPNCPEFNLKGAAKIPANESVEFTNDELEALMEKVGHINKGAFHRWLGKSQDEPITAADVAKGKAAGGHAEKMAIFAQNFGHVGH